MRKGKISMSPRAGGALHFRDRQGGGSNHSETTKDEDLLQERQLLFLNSRFWRCTSIARSTALWRRPKFMAWASEDERHLQGVSVWREPRRMGWSQKSPPCFQTGMPGNGRGHRRPPQSTSDLCWNIGCPSYNHKLRRHSSSVVVSISVACPQGGFVDTKPSIGITEWIWTETAHGATKQSSPWHSRASSPASCVSCLTNLCFGFRLKIQKS